MVTHDNLVALLYLGEVLPASAGIDRSLRRRCVTSRYQPAFEQLVGDRRRNAIDEFLSHPRVLVQHSDEALFHLPTLTSRAMPPLLCDLLARGGPILLYHPFGDAVEDRILLRRRTDRKQHSADEENRADPGRAC